MDYEKKAMERYLEAIKPEDKDCIIKSMMNCENETQFVNYKDFLIENVNEWDRLYPKMPPLSTGQIDKSTI